MDKTCQEKMAFDTQAQAKNAAVVAHHRHGTKLKVYKCKNCQLWHLATNYET